MERFTPMAWRPVFGPEGELFVSGKSIFFIFGGQRSCNGRGGAQRPVWGGNEFKKRGARSAQARTRGQNPLVNIYSPPQSAAPHNGRSADILPSLCLLSSQPVFTYNNRFSSSGLGQAVRDAL
jgi:hypothetical protein